MVVVMATASGTSGTPMTFLLHGVAGFSGAGWTAGGKLYLSTTAGSMTHTRPSGTDQVIQVLGYALTTTTVYFNPSPNQITAV
jgi:hypothetical protein